MINRRISSAGAVAAASDPAGRSPNGGPMNPRDIAKGWSPTVANLLVLLVLEIVAFGVIRVVFHRLTD